MVTGGIRARLTLVSSEMSGHREILRQALVLICRSATTEANVQRLGCIGNNRCRNECKHETLFNGLIHSRLSYPNSGYIEIRLYFNRA